MVPNRRLLILSCSQRKRPDLGYLPAIERYDGPAFRVLRRYLRKRPDEASRLDVYILSAAYGLIPVTYPIVDYNQMMTQKRAAELHDGVLGLLVHLLCSGYRSLCLAMSKVYLLAFDGWPALVPQGVQVTLTDGSQGMKLAQLKRWLWGDTQGDVAKQRDAKPHGYARIRGIEVTMTPEQVLDIARKALAEGRGMSNRYHSWYVQVDDRQVAPKWLVGQLTGLPVSAFVTNEARRFLTQLGIKVMHV
jgi:hypothetical protein